MPQPVSVIPQSNSNIQPSLRALLPARPSSIRGSGETSASSIPEDAGSNWLLEAPLIVIFVLWGAPPESVAGAKLQPHPLGKPEQAKDSEALKPFSGVTETVRDPDVPCVMLRVLLDSVSP